MRCHSCGATLRRHNAACPQCGTEYRGPGRVVRYLERIEEGMLVISLATMIILVVLQIVLRNALNSGIIGADSMIRHMVLWIGFIGAAIAARDDSHVRIDALSRMLGSGGKAVANVLVCTFSSAVCFFLTVAAWRFIAIEYQANDTLPLLNVPIWIMELVIPFGYLIIAIRFARKGLKTLTDLVKGC